MFRSLACTCYSFLVLLPMPTNAAPSFDCHRAVHEIEKLICSDAKLAALDLQMAESFSAAMRRAKASDKPELLAEQRGWIKNRNSCAKRAEPRRNCVTEHYVQRNSRLEELLNEDTASAPSRGAGAVRIRLLCGDGIDITAHYRSGTSETVQIARGDRVWVLPRVASASGARYAQNDIVFWNKGREVLFEQGDRTVTCREHPERP